MTYETIVEYLTLAAGLGFIIGSELTSDPHKQQRRLLWAILFMVAYVADNIQ
jgi:hypothetical protein